MPPDMAREYIIRQNFEEQWQQGQSVADSLLRLTQDAIGISYFPVHGDPVLSSLDDHDLLCYFVYTLSSWWEVPLIDRINSNRHDNNFAILMDINPAPETMYRLANAEQATPEIRYKSGLEMMFESMDSIVAAAMYNHLRNGFGHNLFGREPAKIRFDNDFACPPILSEDDVLLVPPVKLALSMVTAFVARIVMLLLYPSDGSMRIFKSYMTGNI